MPTATTEKRAVGRASFLARVAPKRAKKTPRIPWDWAPTPRLLAGSGVSAYAQAVAFQIAEALDLKVSNRGLYVDVLLGNLAERLSLNRETVRNALTELDNGGWLEVESRGVAGLRVRFMPKCYRPS